MNILNNKTEKFINNAIKIHGVKYNYSKVEYIKAIEKVIIICKIHGEFKQTPNCHLNGSGCRFCCKTYKSDNADFIKKATEIHGDKYDYSKTDYTTAKEKLTIICRTHGEFQQVASCHISGDGCKKCGIDRCSQLRKNNTLDFIQKAIEIHGDQYDYSKVEYSLSNEKVIIICKIHGEFEQTPNKHLRPSGCNKCANTNRADNLRKTKNEFIKKGIEIHGEKYDYSEVKYINNHTEISIICKEHGEFSQIPYVHLNGMGCQKCGNNFRYDTNGFIEKAKLIHGDSYNYSLSQYKNNRTKISIICKKHGEFEQTPNGHLGGSGCQKCHFEIIGDQKRKTNEQFIIEANNIHNNEYDYSKVEYIDSHTKVIIICSIHGEFEKSPNKHIYKNNPGGCPRCQIKKQYSKIQIKWLNFISIKDNIHIQHAENDNEFLIPNTNYKADGYCQKTNTIFEFHGDYWHGNPKIYDQNRYNKTTNCTFGELYEKTLKKESIIIELGYNLVIIWESEWNKINKSISILQKKIKKYACFKNK